MATDKSNAFLAELTQGKQTWIKKSKKNSKLKCQEKPKNQSEDWNTSVMTKIKYSSIFIVVILGEPGKKQKNNFDALYSLHTCRQSHELLTPLPFYLKHDIY